jgi:hypothetical protein
MTNRDQSDDMKTLACACFSINTGPDICLSICLSIGCSFASGIHDINCNIYCLLPCGGFLKCSLILLLFIGIISSLTFRAITNWIHSFCKDFLI